MRGAARADSSTKTTPSPTMYVHTYHAASSNRRNHGALDPKTKSGVIKTTKTSPAT
jgi:hypothetical protein